MSSPAGVHIRFGVPSDQPALLEYEKTYFPAVPGQYHAGYLFEHVEMAAVALTEDIAVPKRAFNLVAEDAGGIIGFAAAIPSRLPGLGTIDRTNMVLMHVAVDPDRRNQGIGSALIAEVERLSIAARQNVIVAHVSAAVAGLYRQNGWTVLPEGRGFAWVPFNDHLRADLADPGLGFPLMAAKVLRPKALRFTFDFPITRDAPMFDAANELARMTATGDVDARDLDSDTLEYLQMARIGQSAAAGGSFRRSR